MNLKEKFYNLFGLYLEKQTSKKRVLKLIKKLLPVKIDIELIRLGENNDGGYIIPNDLEGITKNYSAGIGKLVGFEKDLQEKFSINSNMLDFNEIDRNILPNNCNFLKKKLSLKDNDTDISINNWIDNLDKEVILKIDIEGDEYPILANISDENLKKIRILIIELHDLRNLRNNVFFSFFEKIISRFDQYFYSCHLHPNNSSKVKFISNIEIPDMLEITFIKKNRLSRTPTEYIKLPHALDQRTITTKKEIFIDQKWYD